MLLFRFFLFGATFVCRKGPVPFDRFTFAYYIGWYFAAVYTATYFAAFLDCAQHCPACPQLRQHALRQHPHPRRRHHHSLLHLSAFGPFFRPTYKELLTSFHVLKGWKWYQQCRGRGNNPYASSQKSYFGFDPLSFAARSLRLSLLACYLTNNNCL